MERFEKQPQQKCKHYSFLDGVRLCADERLILFRLLNSSPINHHLNRMILTIRTGKRRSPDKAADLSTLCWTNQHHDPARVVCELAGYRPVVLAGEAETKAYADGAHRTGTMKTGQYRGE